MQATGPRVEKVRPPSSERSSTMALRQQSAAVLRVAAAGVSLAVVLHVRQAR